MGGRKIRTSPLFFPGGGARTVEETLVLTTGSAPGYPGRSENDAYDEAYDEDGNQLQNFYDLEPPGMESPASAPREAEVLNHPGEIRY